MNPFMTFCHACSHLDVVIGLGTPPPFFFCFFQRTFTICDWIYKLNLIAIKVLNRGNYMGNINNALHYFLSASNWSSKLDHIFLSLSNEVRLSAHPPELHRWPQSDRRHHPGAGGRCRGLDRRENTTHWVFPRYSA